MESGIGIAELMVTLHHLAIEEILNLRLSMLSQGTIETSDSIFETKLVVFEVDFSAHLQGCH